MSNKSKSLIAGGLTSSAGVFITKILGIVYVPFLTAMAGGEATASYYTDAYVFYNWILIISQAGIPFAIATMIAKYQAKDDYKTMLLVRKIGLSVVFSLGFICMVLFMSLSGVVAGITNSVNATPDMIQKTANVYIIVSLALFVVPLLSGHRGFFQGIKEFKTYAFSQILEQIARVSFMLALGFLAIYIFNKDGIWAVYFAVGSAAFAALVAIIHLVFFHKKAVVEIQNLAATQKTAEVEKSVLWKEFVYFAIPYFLYAILGNSMDIVNGLFFKRAMDVHSTDPAYIRTLWNMINTNANKITSIPQVLALGFSPAIIPFVTQAFERRDHEELKRNITDALQTVLYIGLPICFFIFAIPEEIYYVVIGGSNYTLGGEVLKWSVLTAFFGTLSPVCNSLMMALRYRKLNIAILGLGFLMKLAITIPFIGWFGYSGAITSSALVSLVIVVLDLIVIYQKYDIDFLRIAKKTGIMFLAMAIMYLAMIILQHSPLYVMDFNRLIGLVILAVYGVVGVSIYLLLTSLFKLPRDILGIDFHDILRKIKGFLS